MSAPDKKWFLARAGKISGPHAEATVEAELKMATIRDSIQFWTRGQSQWLDGSNWASVLKQAAYSQASRETAMWSVELEGYIQNLTTDQVHRFIEKNLDDVWKIRFKPSYVESWLEISQLPSLMSLFGLDRSDERAPLIGNIRLEFAGKYSQARARDISVSGVGMSGLEALPMGEIVPVVLDSPNLSAVIHTHAQLIYRNADGLAGIRFVGLTAEHSGTIVDYLKRFDQIRRRPINDSLKMFGRAMAEKTVGGS